MESWNCFPTLYHFGDPKETPRKRLTLPRLIQNYLDDKDEDGLILALDWEKALDRCSWRYYHNALIALNFGPNFRQMLSLLANQAHPASRKVKIN
jgi:hypothetical protein